MLTAVYKKVDSLIVPRIPSTWAQHTKNKFVSAIKASIEEIHSIVQRRGPIRKKEKLMVCDIYNDEYGLYTLNFHGVSLDLFGPRPEDRIQTASETYGAFYKLLAELLEHIVLEAIAQWGLNGKIEKVEVTHAGDASIQILNLYYRHLKSLTILFQGALDLTALKELTNLEAIEIHSDELQHDGPDELIMDPIKSRHLKRLVCRNFRSIPVISKAHIFNHLQELSYSFASKPSTTMPTRADLSKLFYFVPYNNRNIKVSIRDFGVDIDRAIRVAPHQLVMLAMVGDRLVNYSSFYLRQENGQINNNFVMRAGLTSPNLHLAVLTILSMAHTEFATQAQRMFVILSQKRIATDLNMQIMHDHYEAEMRAQFEHCLSNLKNILRNFLNAPRVWTAFNTAEIREEFNDLIKDRAQELIHRTRTSPTINGVLARISAARSTTNTQSSVRMRSGTGGNAKRDRVLPLFAASSAAAAASSSAAIPVHVRPITSSDKPVKRARRTYRT